MRLLIFAGAGTSIELGVPGMLGLGEEFVSHSEQWDVEPELVRKIIGASLDVELLIEEIDRLCSVRGSLAALGEETPSLGRVEKIRAEVEWFVQHAAERIVASDAQLMWGSVLRSTDSLELTIVTTNYDRAIEIAANGENLSLDDGFEPFGEDESANWKAFDKTGDPSPLIKLHGSTDWYSNDVSHQPVKLRHPMPLFGRVALVLANGLKFGSALILPSREKLLTHDPYPRLSQAFLNASDECDAAIFVGSSMRDSHIRGAAKSISERAPLFIVNPQGNTYGMENACVIPESASTFLIGTLPNALASDDPIETLKSANHSSFRSYGSLAAVRLALDTDADSRERCHMLEELDERNIALDPTILERLLNDESAEVARYSLGLISLSAARRELLENARQSTHLANAAFAEDLKLLEAMIPEGEAAPSAFELIQGGADAHST